MDKEAYWRYAKRNLEDEDTQIDPFREDDVEVIPDDAGAWVRLWKFIEDEEVKDDE